MGEKNVLAREMLQNPAYIADLVNGHVFHGEQIVKAQQLSETDTAAALNIPGTKGSKPVRLERFRDAKKLWCYKAAGKEIYVSVLAVEHHSLVHYAAPVKDLLYDVVDLAKQVQHTAAEHRKERKAVKDGEPLSSCYTPNSGEFLGGFWKNDRLIPVYTITLFLSSEPWTGPRRLSDMYAQANPKILAGCVEYDLNLIVPAELTDEHICSWFQTDLREVFLLIKHARSMKETEQLLAGAQNIETRFDRMSRIAAELTEKITGLPAAKTKEEDETVSMSQAAIDLLAAGEAKGEAIGIIKMCRKLGKKDNEIIQELIAEMNISIEAAREYLKEFSAKSA